STAAFCAAAAGAPSASRSSRIRLADGSQRLRQRESACVEGLADDRAFHTARAVARRQLRQIAKVVEAGDSTGGDHRSFRAGTHRAQQLQVRATQWAVLADVGDLVTLSTVGVQPLQYLPQVSPVGGPAEGGEPVFVTGDPHVQPDGHAVAVLADDARGPLRVL